MIDFTDDELKYLHDLLADDIEDSTSKLNAINKCENKEAIKLAVASDLYSGLLNCAETGLTAMRKILFALGDEELIQEELQSMNKALNGIRVNREYLIERGLLKK